MRRQALRELSLLLVSVALLGALVCYHTRDVVHADVIAYARIAGYYASGRLDLAVTQVWSPLFSWLLVPLVGTWPDLVHLGRVGMLLSGLVFAVGCYVVLRIMTDDTSSRRIGMVVLGGFTLFGINREITPDLLMAGLFAPGVALAVSREWLQRRRRAFAAGLLLGAAALAKGVALPAAAVLLAGLGTLRLLVHTPRRPVLIAMLWTIAGVAVLVGPWLSVLSSDAGHLTTGAAGRVNFALMGPTDVDRFHPTFRILHTPAPGRITSWEAPETMPYRSWSPLESPEYRAHWLTWLRTNAVYIVGYLARFDLLGLGVVCALLALLAHAPWRQGLAEQPWRWAAFGVAVPTVMYVPFWTSTRYFYSAYPFLVVATLGVTRRLLAAPDGGLTRGATRTLALVLGAAFLPITVPSVALTLAKERCDVETLDARVWGAALRAAGVAGSVAGSVAGVGPNGHTALYVAAFTERPFVGNVLQLEDPHQLEAVDARVVFVAAESPAVALLDASPGYARLPAPAKASERLVAFVRRP